MALVLETAARNRGVVVGAETGSSRAMRVVQAARRAERMQGRAALDRLRGHHGGARDKRGAVMQVIRDRVVRGVESRVDDALRRDALAQRGIAQRADQVDILRRMDELELLDGR